MNAWLIYDREGAERNQDYIEYHYEAGARYGVTFQLVYAEGFSSEIEMDAAEASQERKNESVFNRYPFPEFAIVRTINPQINRLLEDKNIPTFNNSKVSSITNHKYQCIDYISKHTTVPTIPIKLLANKDDSFDEAIRTISTHVGDVIKPVSGHGGAGVMRIPESGLSEEEIIKLLSQGDVISQPFIDGPGEDVRVYVIGDRIIAAVRRHATDGDFRANASLGGSISRYTLSEKETDYVNQIIRCFDFGMVVIDFIIDKNNNFIFNEIEDVVGARMLYKVYPEIDILDMYIQFITNTNM